ncbi:MAG: amino acid permease [Bacteroidia bacterium]|nr:amino acid permease [Bacteroidia bacterium]MCX7764912.1 amino acid permease [Bacteroidia bacterium]MDW8057534.1 amino acid permease [Bacteroidia bacterium]
MDVKDFLKSLFRTKAVEAYQKEAQQTGLRRALGRWSLVSLGIGAIIGGGIFTLTGVAAKLYAGPALALSFVIAGFACLLAAMAYAEFASIVPVEGSAYAYSYATVGEIVAWFIGWNLILEYMMGATTVAVAWSGYFEKLLHLFDIHLPYWLVNDPFTAAKKARELNEAAPPFAINLPGFLISWLVTSILLRGIKETASTNNLIVFIKVGAVLFVILAGLFFINPDNWTPFIPEPEIDAAGNIHYGWSGVFTAATIVFFAYIGFDAVSTQAGEAINPRRDVPFAIVASLLITTLLYIGVSVVLTGMVPYKMLDERAPVASAFAGAGVEWATYIITFAAVAGLISVMLVMLLGQTRIFLAMAKDGLLPEGIFGYIHPKYKTPFRSTLLVGAIMSLTASFVPIVNVSELTSLGTLLAFTLVSLSVFILRIKRPELERPYKAPLWPLVSLGGALVNIFLMSQARKENLRAFAIWGALGLLVYFLYSRRKSKLHQ